MLDWLAFQGHRFMYWTGERSAAIQALSSVVTVVLTAVLAGVTYWYVRLTHTIATSSVRQLELSRHQLKILVQPNLHLQVDIVVLKTSVGHRHEAQFDIVNRGAYPVKTGEVTLSWQRDDNLEWVKWPFRDFKDRVIPGGETVSDRLPLTGKPGIKEGDSEAFSDSFSDFLLLNVECSDLSGLWKLRYGFQNAGGLYFEELP